MKRDTSFWVALVVVLAGCRLGDAPEPPRDLEITPKLPSVSALATVRTSKPPLPNIVLIMVDDLGFGDLADYGSKAIQTPHLDALWENGVAFYQYYAGCTVCASSRSVLMTGMHTGQTSVRLNSGGVPLRDADFTLAELLKKAGYATGGFGKWGLGDLGTEGAPEKQGFDEFFGYYHQVHAHNFYPPYLIDTGRKVQLPGNEGFDYRRRPAGFIPAEENGKQRQYAHYEITKRTLEFIRKNKDRRFFCYAPWTPPHGKYHLPKDDPAVSLYLDNDWPVRAKVAAAMITMLDRQVGEVVALLSELGLEKNTLVLFTSDNGPAFRFEGSLNSAGQYRGAKRSLYEGGIRVPLIASWPGTIPKDIASGEIHYAGDFMATFAQLTGTEEHVPSTCHSVPMVKAMKGARYPHRPRHKYLYWEWQRPGGGLMQAVRSGGKKIVRHAADAPWEYYDLAFDPGETMNDAAKQPRLVDRMIGFAKEAHQPMRPQKEPDKPAGKRYR